jgi:hypothetical protein
MSKAPRRTLLLHSLHSWVTSFTRWRLFILTNDIPNGITFEGTFPVDLAQNKRNTLMVLIWIETIVTALYYQLSTSKDLLFLKVKKKLSFQLSVLIASPYRDF